jgi:phage-related protein
MPAPVSTSAHPYRRIFCQACLTVSNLVHVNAREESLKRLPAFFYARPSGREPVREWLKSLDEADRKLVGEDVKDVEFSWPIGMPLCRALGGGLWEVRSQLTRGRIARVLFCVHQGRMVLLHAFMKTTQKTPKPDMELALKRMKEIT